MSLLNESSRAHPFDMPVICWRCDAPMRIKTITPTITSPSLDEIIYSCPACHDERTQTVLKTG